MIMRSFNQKIVETLHTFRTFLPHLPFLIVGKIKIAIKNAIPIGEIPGEQQAVFMMLLKEGCTLVQKPAGKGRE